MIRWRKVETSTCVVDTWLRELVMADRDEAAARDDGDNSDEVVPKKPTGDIPDGFEPELRYYTKYNFRCPVPKCKKYGRVLYKKNNKEDCIVSAA